MNKATGSNELVERLREAGELDRSLGLLDLLEILGSRLQEAADRITDLEARLARAEASAPRPDNALADDAVERAAEDWMHKRFAPDHPNDCDYDADEMIDAFMAGAALSTLTPSPAVGLLREAAKGLLARASDTYRKRNGHVSSIEADDGEKCWIVHSDDIEDLRRAVDAALKEAK
jgi:hypothetical protein